MVREYLTVGVEHEEYWAKNLQITGILSGVPPFSLCHLGPSCDLPFFEFDGQCVETCPALHFGNDVTGRCEECKQL